MALAGCTGVFVGFESLTDENLADARKKTPLSDRLWRLLIQHDLVRAVWRPFAPAAQEAS